MAFSAPASDDALRFDVAVGPSSASTPAATGLLLAPGTAATSLATPSTVTATASLTATGGSTGYTFTGFFAPVDNAPVFNTVKAGSAIPAWAGLVAQTRPLHSRSFA